MEVQVYLKGKKGPVIFMGDRIDILDFEMNNIKYKQIRYFKKGFSKSQYVECSVIKNIKEIK